VPRPPKMTVSVTRQELRTELEAVECRLNDKLAAADSRFDAVDVRLDRVEHRLDGVEGRLDNVAHRLERVEERVDKCATRTDLEIWAGALEHRLPSSLTTTIATTIATALVTIRQELSMEAASHARAMEESASAFARAIDDKYADLPARVAALERATDG
jgi:chromosome segregation ATPase